MALRLCLALTAAFSVLCSVRFTGAQDESVKNSPPTDEYVQAALEYEIQGDNDRRQAMLTAALEAAPDAAAPNWHAGRVQRDGRWIEVVAAQRLAAADPLVSQYRDLRRRAGEAPNLQLALARWCARQGLPDLAQLHYARLVKNPQADARTIEEALKKLNVRIVGGVPMTEDEIAAQRQAAEQMERAIQKWRPSLEKRRQAAESDRPKQRELAAQELDQIDDPHVVFVAETFLGDSGSRFGEQLVRLAARFDQFEATQTLVRFAVLSPWPNVREAAIAQLKRRPLHDYLPTLLNGLAAPIESQWSLTRDPVRGTLRYQHVFSRAGQQGQDVLAREHIATPRVALAGQELLGERTEFGENLVGFRPVNDGVREQQAEALRLYATALVRERAVARENARVQANNDQLLHVLQAVTGVNAPQSPEQWWNWWENYNQDVKPKPTRYLYLPTRSAIYQNVVAQYRPITEPPRPWTGTSCFAAGTKVWTETGFTPIEQLQPGDRVLSQDPDTGELAFKLVLEKTAGQPTSGMMRLMVEGEEILPTFAHVMWVNGQGWLIARKLKWGDWLHGLKGALLVDETEERPAPPLVHNLVVQDFHTYFVGDCGLMVHDITYRQPTRALVPGLTVEKSP